MARETKEFLRIPPQNIEAEQAVLGSILIDNDMMLKVLEILSPEDFYRANHRLLFEAIVDLFEKNQPIDLITIADLLQAKKQVEEAGGLAYLSALADGVPTASSAPYYARIVREKGVLRRLISVGTEIAEQGYEADVNMENLMDQAEQSIFEISEDKIRPNFYPLKDIIKSSFKTIEQLFERKELVTGVPSGFPELDKYTSGFQSSDLIVIAGRPSMGKTAFALNIAQHVATKADPVVPVAIFSLEMSREQLGMRFLCAEAEIDSNRLRSGFLSDKDWPSLTTAAGVLAEAPVFIDDSPALTILELRAKARRLKMEKKIGLVIVDYLQLIRGRSSAERREQEISEISRALKALAKELNVPVLALSQLNRKVEDRADKRPQLSDLRESGAIEQDADVILCLYREVVYDPDITEKNIAEVLIRKQRNGPIGMVKLIFLDKFTRFAPLDQTETPF
jgi:replicative DNA helicase